MPLVKIEMLKGKPAAYRKTLLDEVHQALVESIKIPDSDRNQKILEYPEENFEIQPGRTKNAVFIEISLFEGRSPEAKKTLYQNIVRRLEKELKIDPADVLILLHEEPMHNWAIRGGLPAGGVNPGFQVKT